MNGADGSTSFVDDMGLLWSAAGTTISTAQGVSGGASGYFSGGSVRANNAALLNLGTAAFTVDFWMYPNDAGNNTYLAGRSHPDGGQGYDVRLDQGEILIAGVNGWGFNIGTYGPGGANYVQVGQWAHVALSSTETTAYLFYNGVLRGSSPRSAISDGLNAFAIGYQSNFGGTAFSGYIDDFRYSDTALWTEDFTPGGEVPEPATLLLIGAGLLVVGCLRRRR